MSSRFDFVQQGPPIEVFQLNRMFLEDPHPSKVNLSIGGKLNCNLSGNIYCCQSLVTFLNLLCNIVLLLYLF